MQTIEITVGVLAVLNGLGWLFVIVAWAWRDRLINELRDAMQADIRLMVEKDGRAYLDISLLDARYLAEFQRHGGERASK